MSSLKSAKLIYDISPFTHLDYPDHLAAILWFYGCNMRCDYCYNPEIVFAQKAPISLQEALDFLETRVGLLDAVVLSGGEATTHLLVPFVQALRQMGFKIKLDTNGINVDQISQLLHKGLLDYVALDYKAPEAKFTQITHSRHYSRFSKTLDLLLADSVDFEVRTTVHADLLNEEDINAIICDLHRRGYNKSYYLQNFLETAPSIGDLKKPSAVFDPARLDQRLEIVWR